MSTPSEVVVYRIGGSIDAQPYTTGRGRILRSMARTNPDVDEWFARQRDNPLVDSLQLAREIIDGVIREWCDSR